ncbi:MAG: Ig-like domain-containing protein [bacterium]|nr:Ig-like domain-containing protein [bacterium]
MRRTRFALLLVGVMLALSLGGFVTAQETPERPVLQVVELDPPEGVELELNAPITIYFDHVLDCTTAADAVSISPEVAGETACDETETALVFTPNESFARATTYTVTISDSLRGAQGEPLAEPVRFEVTTAGFLRVTDVLPAPGSVDIATDALVTVIFNRPVVPLGSVEDMENLPDPLTISPAVEGEGEWLNTAIYTFRPTTAWAGGTEYTITVDPALTAVDGSTLEEAFTWSFTTAAPQIVEVNPLDQTVAVSLEPMIQVTFNQPMDRASVEEAFFMRPVNGGGEVAGTFEWNETNTGFAFEPEGLLALDTVYEVGFPENAAFEVTGQSAIPATTWQLATVPAPSITGTTPIDGETEATPYGGVTLYFASLMEVETLEDKVTIEPEPWREPDYFYADYNNALTINFPMEPSTTYTVTVEPGMADIYGNVIEESFTFSFTTAPYSPEYGLRVPGPVGFYNAYNDITQIFVTQRNVSRVDLSLFNVDLGTFLANATNPDTYYDPMQGFTPDPAEQLLSWQVPNVAPVNALRYDLIDMRTGARVDLENRDAGADTSDPSDDATPEATSAADAAAAQPTASCPGAPPSRVNVGDIAVVITTPDPLRARSTPPDGEIVDLLYYGYAMEIVGGPVCANDLTWWEVTLRDDRTAWVAEGLPEEYFIETQIEGSGVSVPVPGVTAQAGEEGPLTPGIYYLEANTPETVALGYAPQRHMMVVATANLSLKVAIDQVTVWATDVQSGLPIPDAPITLYGPGGQVISEGTTDADGLLMTDIPRLSDLYFPVAAVLLTGDQFGLGLSSWTEGIDPWLFGQPDNFYPRQYQIYTYTDRPIYRPGQPVYFRGVLRSKDDMNYTVADLATVPVRISNDMGEIIFEEEVALTPFGTFSGRLDLAEDAGLGYYYINIELPSSGRFVTESGGVSFGVAEYRLPEFQVEVAPEQPEVVQGDTINLTLDSRYFFGGAVSNAEVEYSVISQDYFFQFAPPEGRYDFIDFDYDAGAPEFYGGFNFGEPIATGSGTTDAQGRLMIEVPANLEDYTQSQTFTIEVTVTDESEQAVSGRAEIIVHKGLIYIGARADEYVSQAGEETTFRFIAIDWDGNPIPQQEIDVQIVERLWSSVQEQDENGRTTWTYEVEEIPVTDGSVTTGDDGRATFTFTPTRGGIYKAIITTMDEAGNEVRSATTIWVSSGEYVSWRQQNSNRIELIADQDSYEIGDVAQVLITSPFLGTSEALITVERGDVLTVERITLESNSYVYEFPIEDNYAPNVFVSVLLVKGVDENNPVAAFRLGLVQIGVETERKELTIEITPNVETAAPGETVTYTVLTTDYAGNPVAAEVGVGLTDLASLSIADPNSPEILPFFYGNQGLSVRTATPLTINTDQITQTVLDTIKGGGGGAGEGGIFDIREDFVDTAYWNPQVVTDENGTATFEVTLPDNLTTWRLDARAVTRGDGGLTLVGQDTFDLLSTRPLLIRPVTPRFFVVNDQVVLAAIVNNNTESDQVVEVNLQATGVTFEGESLQTVTIPAGGRQRVNWPVTVDDVAAVDLTFFARTTDDSFSDASKPPLGQGDERLLPVYRYEAPEVTGTGGVLREEGTRTEGIVLPQRFDVTQGELRLNVDTSIVEPVLRGLDYLAAYRSDNIETTISRFLPNLMAFRVLQNDPAGSRPELEERLNLLVNLALQRLTAQQKPDGGWGWYVQDQSNPLVTAYALIGLAEARASGFAVDDAVLERAIGFLRTEFIAPGNDTPDWQFDRQAFILYALARAGAPDVARTSALYDFRERLSIYAKAMLALTFDVIGAEERSRIDTLLSDLANDAILSANGAHWEEDGRDLYNWNTDTRTTALVLTAFVRLNPDSDLIPNIVRWLMTARTVDYWETTQETAWALMALSEWLAVSDELGANYDFSVTLNGEERAASNADDVDGYVITTPVTDLLADEVNELVITRGAGPGTLYYDTYLRAYLPVPEIEAENRGIIIERRYTLAGSEDNTSITEAQVGELVEVHLTIIAPNDLYYVVIEDPIPAGTDAVNPELETSQQIGTRPETLLVDDPLSRGWGYWWFSNIDFRDEMVVLNATFLPAGTYEFVYTIRTGLPGVYNVIPATGVEFYFPDVYGRSAGTTFTITPEE